MAGGRGGCCLILGRANGPGCRCSPSPAPLLSEPWPSAPRAGRARASRRRAHSWDPRGCDPWPAVALLGLGDNEGLTLGCPGPPCPPQPLFVPSLAVADPEPPAHKGTPELSAGREGGEVTRVSQGHFRALPAQNPLALFSLFRMLVFMGLLWFH